MEKNYLIERKDVSIMIVGGKTNGLAQLGWD